MSRFWKWTLGVVAILVLLCVLAYVVAHNRATAFIESELVKIEAELEVVAKRVNPRPVLDPWPGEVPPPAGPLDAWPIYARAAAALGSLSAEEQMFLAEFPASYPDAEDEQAARAFFASQAGLLQDLQTARFADRISMDPTLRDAMFGAVLEVVSFRDEVGNLLRGATRHALLLGQHEQTLRLIEMRLCLGRDVASTGCVIHRMLGLQMHVRAAFDARGLLAQGGLDADVLTAFGRTLDRLEENRPAPGDAWVVDDLLLREVMAKTVLNPDASAHEVTACARWRHLYSTRLWAAEYLELMPHWTARIRALDGLLPRAAWLEAERIHTEADEVDHSMLGMTTVLAPNLSDQYAFTEIIRHLLRVSTALAAYRATHGAWPATLDDLVPAFLDRIDHCPATGLPLGYAEGRVWSAGGDGEDDGGTPNLHDWVWRDEGDVVWDLTDKSIPED